MAGRVLVHVGTPKTGTSFLQHLLFTHREALADQGICYPADRFDAHFLAALDLMELRWGGLETQAVGAWDRLAAEVRAWPGTVIVSHEILATASRQQVARVLGSFGDKPVHVVVSARDLVRQIPAEWQETVKHRRTIRFADYLAAIRDPARRGELASWFWGVQDVPDILDRWASTLPPERVHLVTVPGPDAPPDLLWRRFASVFGLAGTGLQPSEERVNPSLGVAETALLREVNARVDNGVLGNADYRQFVRELLAHRTLSHRPGRRRLLLPADARAWAADLCERWVAELSGRGYDVVGDLAELRPGETDPAAYADPDHPDRDEVWDAALLAITTLLKEAVRLQQDERRAASELATARAELERSRGPVRRAKQRLVRAADGNRAAALGLAAYRRVRGSSSRSV